MRRITLVLALQGVALVVLGVVYAAVSATGRPESRLGAELEAALAVLLGAVVLLLARATGAGRAWPRSPAVVVNVIALPVGLGLLQGHLLGAGVVVLGLAGAALWLYATPEARAALREP